jgi:predicted ATP-grasp superfamily ATP-dependent carboligase
VLERFAANHTIRGNSPQTMRAVRRWPDLFARLEQAGFSVPETIFDPMDGIDLSRKWLVKPLLSGGGRGVDFWRQRTFAEKRSMLQQYVPGKACSASFVANGSDAVLIGISELIGIDRFGVRGFRYCGSVLPLPEILEPETGKAVLEQVRRISTFLAREFELTGVNGFDFVLNGKQVSLIEVNPRYCASMELVERAYNLRVFHLHMEAVVDGRLPEFKLELHLDSRKFFGKGVLFSERDCIAPEMFEDPASDLRDVPMAGEKIHAGGPICTLLTHRSAYDETAADLFWRAGKLKEQIYG